MLTAGCLVILEHGEPAQGRPSLGLLGKGVTHDLGGYDLKRAPLIARMSSDKAGAGAVAGAMRAIAGLQVPLHATAVLPIAENGLDRPAYKPGDILRAMDGTRVFVESTDAEGRLLLADAMCWLEEFGPDLVIDLATLTGAAAVGLGEPYAALYSNDDAVRGLLESAGRASGDLVWPMPIHDLHDRDLGHPRADVRNMAPSPVGAASVAAAFLRTFARGPWAHIDMAGKAVWDEARDVLGVGATGFGCRLLVQAAERLAGVADVGDVG